MKSILALIMFVAAIVTLHDMSYNDEVRELDNYCNMVYQGYWHDYKNIYQSECNAELPRITYTDNSQAF